MYAVCIRNLMVRINLVKCTSISALSHITTLTHLTTILLRRSRNRHHSREFQFFKRRQILARWNLVPRCCWRQLFAHLWPPIRRYNYRQTFSHQFNATRRPLLSRCPPPGRWTDLWFFLVSLGHSYRPSYLLFCSNDPCTPNTPVRRSLWTATLLL